MYTISFVSENPDDLKLLRLLATRLGVQCSNEPNCIAPTPEYQRGFEEGILQGMEQGLVEGIERGAINKAFELAKYMKYSGFDTRTILGLTHLISDDLESL